MANSLLDFVMALVRDPDAAARYAADPAQAIADADLTDVTSTDVQNLIPVVSESLSMSVPVHGVDAFGVEPAGNVWASGAATAAFDAFGDHVPETMGSGLIVDPGHSVPAIVDEMDPVFDVPVTDALVDPGLSAQFDAPAVDDVLVAASATDDDWAQPVTVHDGHDAAPAFDIFD